MNHHTGDARKLMPFLAMAGKGCISGHVSEWPQLIPACKWAYETLVNVKAHLELIDREVGGLIIHTNFGFGKAGVELRDLFRLRQAIEHLAEQSEGGHVGT